MTDPPSLTTPDEGAERAEASAWAPASRSPLPAESAGTPLPGCATAEQALLVTAQAVAESDAAGGPSWEMADVIARLRAAGSPYVWPRLWSARAASRADPAVMVGLTAWLAELPQSGQRRCGWGQAQHGDGSRVFSVLAVDTLAELEPLPTRVRLGQWLRLRAALLVPASNAEVVLLGPRGLPRVVPTELRPGEARAVFSLDQPGMWRIQLLLVTDAGPRPALEAWTFVDREPDASAVKAEAPGERLSEADPDDPGELLLAMLNAARRSEQRLPLRRDTRLDELARAHAEAMRERRLTAHDAGDGLPSERLRRAGIIASLVGENVAHASSLRRAHRALWDSPAHRGTLLDARFEAVGLGVAVEHGASGAEPTQTPNNTRPQDTVPQDTGPQDAGPQGTGPQGTGPQGTGPQGTEQTVWVCELFANYR